MAKYRIEGLLGRGGFGSVYRATLVAEEGFERVVAIKILHNDLNEDAMKRFRDEARILGLIRDRAVVGVAPPIRVGGRLAVVMDFVDGVSAELMVRRHGPIPPRAALEIVQEIARVLDTVYRHPGPDGRPLNILHRDLKPANIQLTPAGAVKVLDFGIAKGQFTAREAHTTSSVLGTTSYMSPSRLLGGLGPEDDIYALGLVLRRLLTAESPVAPAIWAPGPELEPNSDRDDALALADQMSDIKERKRPTAREVEEECERLARGIDELNLRNWAERNVKAMPKLRPDELVGEMLTVSDHAEETQRSGWLGRIAALGLLGGVGTGALGVMLGAILLAFAAFTFIGEQQTTAKVPPDRPEPVLSPTPTPPQPTPDPEPVAPEAPLQPEPTSPEGELGAPDPEPAEPEPVEPEPVEPEPAEPEPDPAPEPEPDPEPEPEHPSGDPDTKPVSVDQEPPPDPVADIYEITFSSVPTGASIRVDGKIVGKTPKLHVKLGEGPHDVRLTLNETEIGRTITVGPFRPKRFIWRGGDVWEVYY